jgi:SAM-dependent methyltransferase
MNVSGPTTAKGGLCVHDAGDLLKRYERFGWDFAAINPVSNEEIAWHLHYAQVAGGPVLELACGTGRLLCTLAEHGFSVTGLDLSHTMVNIARGNAAALPDSARERVRLVQGDMSRFAFDAQFGLIYIAGNSFRELTEPEQHLDCLRCVVRHLRDDGVFLMTERRFDPSWCPGASRESEWSEPMAHPETGDWVQRRYELRRTEDGKWVSGRFLYRTRLGDGTDRVEPCAVLAPVMGLAVYMSLFKQAGLDAKLYVGYDNRPDDGVDPTLCFVCHKK